MIVGYDSEFMFMKAWFYLLCQVFVFLLPFIAIICMINFISREIDASQKETDTLGMISDDRKKHMFGVAEYMYSNAGKYNLNKDDMYLVGLLHDVGYLYGPENHGDSSRKMLFKFGWRSHKYSEYGYAIQHHGELPSENLSDTAMSVCILLNEADMSIDSKGENVGFEKRLKDIAERYGEETEIYSKAKEMILWLKEKGDSGNDRKCTKKNNNLLK